MTPPIAIGIIFILAAIVITIGVRRIIRGDTMSDRLHVYAALPQETRPRLSGRDRTKLTRLRGRINAFFAGFTSEKLTYQLLSANWPITPVEYIISRIALTIIGLILGWLITDSPLGGIGLAILIYIIPGILLRFSTNRRRLNFSQQLVDVLVLITGGVKAGFSLLQALEMIVREMRPPASEEFQRVLREVSLGRPITQALDDLADRMDNRDLYLLVTAINIQHQIGGSLSTMLSSVTETIRERIRLFSEVRMLTAQQRMSSYILSLLPFILAGAFFLISPTYMKGLFEPGIICIPIGALVGIILGFFIIQRMARIEI